MADSAREENLLGSLSLAVVDRMLAACREHARSAGEAPAALVGTATFLSGGSVEELSRALGLSHSATVRLVDKLEERGDLERHSGQDGRSLSLVATDQGREVAEEVRSARGRILEQILGSLTPAERNQLAHLHEKMLTEVTRSGAAPTNICRLCDAESCGHDAGRCPVTEARRIPQ